MTDRDHYIDALKQIVKAKKKYYPEEEDMPITISYQAVEDILKLLKEQEAVVRQWTKEIADNQLAHAPDELDRENWDYKKGIWDGLQIAWNIISEGR